MGRDVCISGCWELHSVRFLVFPRIEYLHPLGNWFLCSVTLTIFIYFCLNGISCLSTCAHWLFCHCILLRVWLCLLMSSHQIFAHIVWIPLRLLHAHLSPNAPVPSTLLWPISGYALVCPCLLVWEAQTQTQCSWRVLLGLNRWEGPLPQACWWYFAIYRLLALL